MPVTIFQAFVPGVDKITLNEGTGSLGPRLVAASCWRINSVHLNFNRDMLVNLPEGMIGDNESYLIFETANPSVVLPVIRVVTFRTAPTAAEIFVYGMVQNTQYTIKVIADVLDIYGTPIDHDYDSWPFLGLGHQVSVPGGLTLFIGLEAGVQKLTETDWRPDLDPPYVENRFPLPTSTRVLVNEIISFDLKDDGSGVRVAATRIWVRGVLVFYDLNPISGWSATVTPISGGYHYELSHSTPFADDADIVIRVYGEDLAYIPNSVDTYWGFHTETRTNAAKIKEIFVVSDDLLQIEFTQDLAVISSYFDLSSYGITPLGGAADVSIEGVLIPLEAKIPYVFLKVKGLQFGSQYQFDVSFQKLHTSDGSWVAPQSGVWLMRRTKVDSVRASLAKFYDTRSRSMIRGVIEAIMISDEKIGGDF